MEVGAPKKILIFSTAYLPFVGGAEVAIKEITDRLPRNYQLDLICAKLDSKLSDHEKIGRVNVFRLGTGNFLWDRLFLPFRGAILASHLEMENHYDLLWGMMVTFGSGAAYIYNIFRMLNGKKKIPIVLTLQEGDSESHLQYKWGGLIALSWKLALRQTDILTGISTFLINRAKRNGYKGQTFLVPNGVDLEIFSKPVPRETRESLIRELNKKSDEIFLVTVGRLTHKNAVDDIISALAKLPKNIGLLIIGKGEDGPDLQKQSEILNVEDRVKFLGFVPYEQIPQYFSICDIFIRPSRSEGFGNSFIEAMAARLPVIATPVGGIVDFTDDKQTGIFCSPDNPPSIVQAVNFLIDNPSLRDEIIDKAFLRVRDNYSWDKIAKDMNLVFNKIP